MKQEIMKTSLIKFHFASTSLLKSSTLGATLCLCLLTACDKEKFASGTTSSTNLTSSNGTTGPSGAPINHPYYPPGGGGGSPRPPYYPPSGPPIQQPMPLPQPMPQPILQPLPPQPSPSPGLGTGYPIGGGGGIGTGTGTGSGTGGPGYNYPVLPQYPYGGGPSMMPDQTMIPESELPNYQGTDFDLFSAYDSLFLSKRIVFLGVANEFTKEAYDQETLSLWYLYMHGYRTIGIEKSELEPIAQQIFQTQTQSQPQNQDQQNVDKMKSNILKAKIKAVSRARARVQKLLRWLDASRLPGSEPLNLFEYSPSQSSQVQAYLGKLPSSERIILLGHGLNLNPNPGDLSLTVPAALAIPSTASTNSPAPTSGLGNLVSQSFPGQVLSVWMLNGGGYDASPNCDFSVCVIEALPTDISRLVNSVISDLGLNPSHGLYFFPTASLPGPTTQSYDFITDLGQVSGELKLNSELILYVGKVRGLKVTDWNHVTP